MLTKMTKLQQGYEGEDFCQQCQHCQQGLKVLMRLFRFEFSGKGCSVIPVFQVLSESSRDVVSQAAEEYSALASSMKAARHRLAELQNLEGLAWTELVHERERLMGQIFESVSGLTRWAERAAALLPRIRDELVTVREAAEAAEQKAWSQAEKAVRKTGISPESIPCYTVNPDSAMHQFRGIVGKTEGVKAARAAVEQAEADVETAVALLRGIPMRRAEWIEDRRKLVSRLLA